MKKYFLLIAVTAFCLGNCFGQAGEWVWLRGDSINNNPGSFGTQGIPSATNDPPSLYEACEFTDLNGNFWLWGGIQNPNGDIFDDLWKYDHFTNEWTWINGPGVVNDTGSYGIQGVASPSNRPPHRSFGALSWVDLNGNFWMFGGADHSLNWYSDLWKYDPGTNEWTWIKGPNISNQLGVYGTQGVPSPTNNPPPRAEVATAWTDDNGDLWLFGGENIGASLNDLWRYTISTNEWTWMKGSQNVNQSAVYGSRGIEDPTNVPGSRTVYSRWKDKSGNLWLLGGLDPNAGMQTDLWRYRLSTNNWTWMHGDNVGNNYGVDGAKCIGFSVNFPSRSVEARATWVDSNGNFYARCEGYYNANALWMYCVASNKWAIVNGDSLHFYGRWGIKGISNSTNIPPVEAGCIGWTDGNGHLYLFGGENGVFINALWMYTIDPCCSACSQNLSENFNAIDADICPGTCTNFTNLSVNAYSYQWYFSGATPPTSTDVNPQSICYSALGNYDVTLVATNGCVSDTLTLSNYITVYPTPPPQSITQNGDTLFAIGGAGTYQWYYNTTIINGATDYFYVAPQSGDYNVVCTDANGCEVEAAVFNVVASVDVIQGQEIFIFPNPVQEKLEVRNLKLEAATINIYNLLGEVVLAVYPTSSIQRPASIDVRTLANGMYWLEVSDGEKTFRSKFVKQ